MHTRRTRVPRAATAALAAGLALTIGAPADAAVGGSSAAPGGLAGARGRAGLVALAASEGRPPEAPPAEAAVPAPAPSGAPAGTGGAQRLAVSGTTATPADTPRQCVNFELDVASLGDRVLLRSQVPDGTSTLVVDRQLNQGARRTVASLPVSGWLVTWTDTTVNPRAAVTYSIKAVSATGATLLECTQYGILVGSGQDGYGDPSFAVARAGSLDLTATWYDMTLPVATGDWVTPAFSADGRLLAGARLPGQDADGAIEVRLASTGSLQFSVLPAADELLADPAFSADGQMMAFSRYSASTGAPVGLGVVDVFGAHTVRRLTADVPVAEPAWRTDGTLVVSAFDAQGGLASLCATCTTATPIPGTAGAYSPEVAPDGTVWFAVTDWNDDGSWTSRLVRRTSGGVVTTVRSDSSSFFGYPRLDPQGTLYYERDHDDGTSFYSQVYEAELSSDGQYDGAIIGSYGSGLGYDVRQPQTKGSSHLVGDRGEDLLARDASGVLWTYPAANGVGNLVGRRQRIGGGWLAYPAVVTGDFTSDDRTDLLAKDAAGGLWLYAGRPTGGMGARVKVGSGWASYLLVSPGDWDGDGRADLLARDASGALWLYPGTGRGTLGPRRQVGSGWNGMNAVLGAGDPDLDNRMDLVARDTAGTLWLYPGRGDGGFLSRRRLGTGWQGFTALAVKEVTDQATYVWARTRSGALYAYPIVGDGRLAGSYDTVGSGWNGYLITS